MLQAAQAGGGVKKKAAGPVKPLLAPITFTRRAKRAAGENEGRDDACNLFTSMQATPKKQKRTEELTPLCAAGMWWQPGYQPVGGLTAHVKPSRPAWCHKPSCACVVCFHPQVPHGCRAWAGRHQAACRWLATRVSPLRT